MSVCVKITRTKDIPKELLQDLFYSVGWESYKKPEILHTAFLNATNVISAWDGERLVGIIRSMDDGVWSANIDCLIVHRDYHNRGIGTMLVNELIDVLKDVCYINVSPESQKNIEFYKKRGFKVVDGSVLLQK